MDNQIEVQVIYAEDGAEGPGWYVWEVECADEGWVEFFEIRPSAEDLTKICAEYVEIQ